MGCGIHSILQRRDDYSDEWVTIDRDVIELGSSSARSFNDFLTRKVSSGVPKDFKIEMDGCSIYTADHFFLGDHSHMHFTVEELQAIEFDKKVNRFSFEEDEYGIHISIHNTVEFEDAEEVVGILQNAFRYLYSGDRASRFRFIVGFDS